LDDRHEEQSMSQQTDAAMLAHAVALSDADWASVPTDARISILPVVARARPGRDTNWG
jgi:hypothetical protein